MRLSAATSSRYPLGSLGTALRPPNEVQADRDVFRTDCLDDIIDLLGPFLSKRHHRLGTRSLLPLAERAPLLAEALVHLSNELAAIARGPWRGWLVTDHSKHGPGGIGCILGVGCHPLPIAPADHRRTSVYADEATLRRQRFQNFVREPNARDGPQRVVTRDHRGAARLDQLLVVPAVPPLIIDYLRPLFEGVRIVKILSSSCCFTGDSMRPV